MLKRGIHQILDLCLGEGGSGIALALNHPLLTALHARHWRVNLFRQNVPAFVAARFAVPANVLEADARQNWGKCTSPLLPRAKRLR